jgi:hypothetical protein
VTVVDVTGWEAAGEEQLGTKPKQWLRSPEDRLWLWKRSEIQRDRRHGEFRKGDDWSEVVAGRLARRLGIPVADVELAVRGPDVGVISCSVLSDAEQLAHGNELLDELGVVSGDPYDRTGYTLDAVGQVLAAVDPPVPSTELPSAFDWFAGYLVLDALIGNTDRHQDNWATIRGGGRRLSPSFDHASCLGFQLSDAERDERLTTADTNRTVAAYARHATTKFEGSPTPIDAAVSGLRRCASGVQRHWAAVLAGAPELTEVLAVIPDDRMSEPARRFASALYRENLASLSYRLRTIDA